MVEGLPRDEAIILAGETRMRQIFMTGLSACIGLVPAALSTGIGAQVQQPLACVVVGGMLLSPICSLLVIPTLARMVMPARVDTEQAGRPATAHRRDGVDAARWSFAGGRRTPPPVAGVASAGGPSRCRTNPSRSLQGRSRHAACTEGNHCLRVVMNLPARLIEGYEAFRSNRLPAEQSRYRDLAEQGQSPEIMVIGCCDSRVSPEVIFDARPGELFVVRNVANLVPPYSPDGTYHGVSAALEFAVGALRVKHIVVLGHASCGGVRAFAEDSAPLSPGDFIGKWMSLIAPPKNWDLVAPRRPPTTCARLEQASIVNTLDNLLTFPRLRRLIERGRVTLHGAYSGCRRYEPPGLRIEHQQLAGRDRKISPVQRDAPALDQLAQAREGQEIAEGVDDGRLLAGRGSRRAARRREAASAAGAMSNIHFPMKSPATTARCPSTKARTPRLAWPSTTICTRSAPTATSRAGVRQ